MGAAASITVLGRDEGPAIDSDDQLVEWLFEHLQIMRPMDRVRKEARRNTAQIMLREPSFWFQWRRYQ